MGKFCINCGAPMEEDSKFCSSCGNAVMAASTNVEPEASQAVPQAQIQTEAVKPREQVIHTPVYDPATIYPEYSYQPAQQKKKGKWLVIVLIAVLSIAVIAAAVVAIFWRSIMLSVAPETVLAEAASNTFTDLQNRYEGSPYGILGSAFDEEGKQTISMNLSMSDAYYGEYDLDFQMAMDASSNACYMDLVMSVTEETADVKLYLDSESAAMGSDRLLYGEFYGITYETFPEDIRGNAMFSEYLGLTESDFSELDEVVELLYESFGNSEYTEEDVQELADEVAIPLVEFLENLEPVSERGVSKEYWSNALGNYTEYDCDTITYTVSSEIFADLIEDVVSPIENSDYLISLYNEDEYLLEEWQDSWEEFHETMDDFRDEVVECSMTFVLHKDYLMGAYLKLYGVEGQEALVEVFFGADAYENDLFCCFEISEDEDKNGLTACLITTRNEAAYGETLQFNAYEYGEVFSSAEFGYLWDADSGDFDLFVSAEDAYGDKTDFAYTLRLTEAENGFVIQLDNFFGLIAAAEGDYYGYYDDYEMPISITVSKGAEFEKPNYRNIDTWTEDDLNQFINGIEDTMMG